MKNNKISQTTLLIDLDGSLDSFLVCRTYVVAIKSALSNDQTCEDSHQRLAAAENFAVAPARPKRDSILVNERLFWSILLELSRSHNYRELCFEKLQRAFEGSTERNDRRSDVPVRFQMKICLVPWDAIMDKSWEQKIGQLIAQQVELENAMAWLSTLGGAFSALGDYDEKFAEAASKVSLKQLKLAMHIGDPATLCRCHIYIAMSLLQRGYFRSCRRIIREQYRFAISTEGQREPKLVKMCQSVWERMRYLYSVKKSALPLPQQQHSI